jgi:hypothetical protein
MPNLSHWTTNVNFCRFGQLKERIKNVRRTRGAHLMKTLTRRQILAGAAATAACAALPAAAIGESFIETVTDGGLLTGDAALAVTLRKFSMDDLAMKLAAEGQVFFRIGTERLVALLDGKRELSVMRLD